MKITEIIKRRSVTNGNPISYHNVWGRFVSNLSQLNDKDRLNMIKSALPSDVYCYANSDTRITRMVELVEDKSSNTSYLMFPMYISLYKGNWDFNIEFHSNGKIYISEPDCVSKTEIQSELLESLFNSRNKDFFKKILTMMADDRDLNFHEILMLNPDVIKVEYTNTGNYNHWGIFDFNVYICDKFYKRFTFMDYYGSMKEKSGFLFDSEARQLYYKFVRNTNHYPIQMGRQYRQDSYLTLHGMIIESIKQLRFELHKLAIKKPIIDGKRNKIMEFEIRFDGLEKSKSKTYRYDISKNKIVYESEMMHLGCSEEERMIKLLSQLAESDCDYIKYTNGKPEEYDSPFYDLM